MALPTPEKTWVFDINNVCGSGANVASDTQDFLFQLINMMIAAGWTVIGSCDGSTYGNNDGVNRITAANKFVFGYSSASSWIILKNPALGDNVHFLIWGEGYGASSGAHTMRMSLTGFGSAYGGTDGTLTTAPAGAVNSSWTIFQGDRLVSSSPFQCTLHFLRSSDNECTRIIVTDASLISTGVVIGYVSIEKAKDPSPIWTVPVFTTKLTYNSTYQNSPFLRPDVLGTTDANTLTRTKIIPHSAERSLHYTNEVVITSALTDNIAQADDASAGWPMIPITLICCLAPARSIFMGTIYDLWWGHYTISNGDTYPSSPAGQLRKFVQLNRLIFPWDGLVTPDGTQIVMS